MNISPAIAAKHEQITREREAAEKAYCMRLAETMRKREP